MLSTALRHSRCLVSMSRHQLRSWLPNGVRFFPLGDAIKTVISQKCSDIYAANLQSMTVEKNMQNSITSSRRVPARRDPYLYIFAAGALCMIPLLVPAFVGVSMLTCTHKIPVLKHLIKGIAYPLVMPASLLFIGLEKIENTVHKENYEIPHQEQVVQRTRRILSPWPM